MKNTSCLIAVSALILSACSQNTSWDSDCAAHFSTTDRELSQCKAKVKEGDTLYVKEGVVSIDPGNTSRQTFDDIGKGGARDDNL